jgi:hypothetical protein
VAARYAAGRRTDCSTPGAYRGASAIVHAPHTADSDIERCRRPKCAWEPPNERVTRQKRGVNERDSDREALGSQENYLLLVGVYVREGPRAGTANFEIARAKRQLFDSVVFGSVVVLRSLRRVFRGQRLQIRDFLFAFIDRLLLAGDLGLFVSELLGAGAVV